jgi:hypothetical protein
VVSSMGVMKKKTRPVELCTRPSLYDSTPLHSVCPVSCVRCGSDRSDQAGK